MLPPFFIRLCLNATAPSFLRKFEGIDIRIQKTHGHDDLFSREKNRGIAEAYGLIRTIAEVFHALGGERTVGGFKLENRITE